MCTWIPNPEPRSHHPPHIISLGHPSAPAPNILYHASNLDWRSFHIWYYTFQCHSPKSSHPLPLPQSPKDCSKHLCFFCCFNIELPHVTFLVAQMVKSLSTRRETWVQSLSQEDLLEKEMAVHSSTIAWKIPWTEEPGRLQLQSMGSQRVGHDWVTSLSLSLSNY